MDKVEAMASIAPEIEEAVSLGGMHCDLQKSIQRSMRQRQSCLSFSARNQLSGMGHVSLSENLSASPQSNYAMC